MKYSSPGSLPKSAGGIKYLAPGDTDGMEFSEPTAKDEAPISVFPNGIIVTGGIHTDNINVTSEANVEKLTSSGDVSIGGNLLLADTTEIIHGTKFRTILVGEEMIRQHWNGSAWVETSKDSE